MARANEVADYRSKPGATDFLQLRIADAPTGRRASWLADSLRAAIADGRLTVGTVLPASRTLAAELGVSRGVVTDAYQRLVDGGQLGGRGRAGTVVLARPLGEAHRPKAPDARPGTVFAPSLDAGVFDRLRTAPAEFDLSPGRPDLTTFPRAAWLRAERAVLDTADLAALGYGDPRGAAPLREAVSAWLARTRGVVVDASEVVIVAGVAQCLAVLAQVLRADGVHAVAIEDPASLGVRQHLQHWGLRTPPVAVDEHGLDVAALGATGHRAVLVTPAHQFPTGVVLDGDRRRALLDWADAGGLIIEDDYDAEHRYDRPPVSALRALAPEQVCYTGSVSKLLAPTLRIGWLIVPARYRKAVIEAKRFADLGNAGLTQLVLARLMSSGDLERHLRALRPRHTARRDAMIAALGRHVPEARIHGAAAGLHLLVTFDDDSDAQLDDAQLAAAALRRGVKVQPLSWHAQRSTFPGLVLGYAATERSSIATAVRRIGAAKRASA